VSADKQGWCDECTPTTTTVPHHRSHIIKQGWCDECTPTTTTVPHHRSHIIKQGWCDECTPTTTTVPHHRSHIITLRQRLSTLHDKQDPQRARRKKSTAALKRTACCCTGRGGMAVLGSAWRVCVALGRAGSWRVWCVCVCGWSRVSDNTRTDTRSSSRAGLTHV
jgi:hypothetical protein